MHNGNGKKHHKVTFSAILLGLVLAGAGAANQFYLAEPLYHPLAGYVLMVPGICLILRALRPPIGFMRVITTILGGASLGACPIFYEAGTDNLPLVSIALVFAGTALLGASFTVCLKKHKH